MYGELTGFLWSYFHKENISIKRNKSSGAHFALRFALFNAARANSDVHTSVQSGCMHSMRVDTPNDSLKVCIYVICNLWRKAIHVLRSDQSKLPINLTGRSTEAPPRNCLFYLVNEIIQYCKIRMIKEVYKIRNSYYTSTFQHQPHLNMGSPACKTERVFAWQTSHLHVWANAHRTFWRFGYFLFWHLSIFRKACSVNENKCKIIYCL